MNSILVTYFKRKCLNRTVIYRCMFTFMYVFRYTNHRTIMQQLGYGNSFQKVLITLNNGDRPI